MTNVQMMHSLAVALHTMLRAALSSIPIKYVGPVLSIPPLPPEGTSWTCGMILDLDDGRQVLVTVVEVDQKKPSE